MEFQILSEEEMKLLGTKHCLEITYIDRRCAKMEEGREKLAAALDAVFVCHQLGHRGGFH